MGASRLQVVRRRSGNTAGRFGSELEAGCAPSAIPMFSMAFQPIVDVLSRSTVGYEALVRGLGGESASTVLDQIPSSDRYMFDEACRIVAIEKAAMLGLVESEADLCVNFYPNAMHEAVTSLRRTLETAEAVGLPLTRMILEMTELERLRDPEHLKPILAEYRKRGLRVAVDDFGAGFAGLSMLASFQPDIVKIDRALCEKIQDRRTSRVIVRGIEQMCGDMGIEVIAEGVEEEAQRSTLTELGIRYMQGNLFSPAAFEALPVWPETEAGAGVV